MRENTICWRCKRSCGGQNGCSWFNGFIPVQGWEAEDTIIINNSLIQKSYKVLSCPQFEEDKREETLADELRRLATERGCSVRTMYRKIKSKRGTLL